MLTLCGRGSGLASAARAVTQAVGGRHVAPTPVPLMWHWEEREESLPSCIPYNYQSLATDIDSVPKPRPQTSARLSKTLVTRQLTVGTGIAGGQQIRYLHNDIKIPDFDGYRRESNKDPTKLAKESRDQRRGTLDLVKVGVGIMAVIEVKKAAQTIVANLSPATSTLALGVIEVDLSKIPEGKSLTVKWNNKPVFLRHRTAEEIAKERARDIKELRDPQTDEQRTSASGEWLIVMGICTHLGCVPIPYQGNWGGYYCPCHGSHYDASGRVHKGPAPLNLEVPDYHIIEEKHTLVLGEKATKL